AHQDGDESGDHRRQREILEEGACRGIGHRAGRKGSIHIVADRKRTWRAPNRPYSQRSASGTCGHHLEVGGDVRGGWPCVRRPSTAAVAACAMACTLPIAAASSVFAGKWKKRLRFL